MKKTPFFPLTLLACYCFFWFHGWLHTPEGHAMSFGKQQQAYQVALHTFGFWDQEHKLKLDVAVWYPGQTQTRMAEYDGWIVQACSHKQSVARVIPGFYPVILLSHDTSSSYFANNDVAAHLASQGFFVIVPAHTGDTTNSGDTTYQAQLLHDRPLQLLQALDLVLSNQHFAPYVDESRIGLLGIGAGAVTTAQLTGMRPEANLLGSYCRENSVYDLTCAGWTENLLTKFGHDHKKLTSAHHDQAFTPSLATYAPKLLEVVPIPPEQPAENDPLCVEEAKPTSGANTEHEKKSLFTKLKDLFRETLPDSDAPGELAREISAPEQPLMVSDFHGGVMYTETLMKNSFILFTNSDDNPWIYPVSLPEKEPQAVLTQTKERKDTRPFRRPADIRQIKAIAFLAPTGAFHFDYEKPNRSLPALSIFPEYSTLYPHAYQAEPYRQLFPSYHEVEVVKGTDHFSLFASCTDQAQAFFPENCGSLTDEDKATADIEKLAALRLFFKQYLGEPYPAQPPTGLKAVVE